MKRGSLIWVLAFILTIAPLAAAEKMDVAGYSRAETAKELLKDAGISCGVCVVLGCDDPAFPVELARASKLLVHILEPDPDQAASARNAAEEAGFPIQRILVEQPSTDSLPHADNSVDLVIFPGSDAVLGDASIAETSKILRPGGKLIHHPGRIQESGLTIPDEMKNANWIILEEPPMEGVDDWSHWEHGPDNNPVSSDRVVSFPYRTQYLAEPYYIAMPAITTAAGGRTFIAMGHIAQHEREEPWLNTLLARNGYNGAELWRMKLPDGYLAHRSAFIATDDTFYMIDLDGSGLLMLDPDTGWERGEINLPEARGEWKWIAMKDGVLYVLADGEKDPAETTLVRSDRSHWSWGELSRGFYTDRIPWGFGTTVLAYDMNAKKVLWTHEEEKPADSRAMVVGDGTVYVYAPDSRVACLDAEDGSVMWENTDPKIRKLIEEPGKGLGSTPGFKTSCFSLYTPDVLFFEAQTRQNVVALSTKDGSFLWSREKTTNNPNMLYMDGSLYVGIGGWGTTMQVDPLTGKDIKNLGFGKRSCARLTATPGFLFCRGSDGPFYDGITRYDRKTGEVTWDAAFRPACNDGVLPANGLFYVGPWLCDCNLSIMGSAALCPADESEMDQADPAEERITKGSEGTRVRDIVRVSAEDWAVYRGDNDHSGSSPVPVDDGMVDIWTWKPERNMQPTVPVAAGGLVFLAGDDGKVRAIYGIGGTEAWTFQTAGPILQPPTIWNDRAYVGSGDGCIYCLEAATGRLLWRFRAAPVERRIMVYGSLCSTWPVNSGVLVEDGVAYAAAGIIDYDGTYLYALDAKTGEVLWENSSTGHLEPNSRKGVSAQGNLTVSNGRLWMAGGNVVSPASYDLATGKYLGKVPKDGSPDANRGEEVAVLGGDCIVYGGRLKYSATSNFVNPGVFDVAPLFDSGIGKSRRMGLGKIPAAWNDERVFVVPNRTWKPQCYRLEDVLAYARTGSDSGMPDPLWEAGLPTRSDVVSVALAPNAAAMVYTTSYPGNLAAQWTVTILDPDTGEQKWQWRLPSAARPGGLLVDLDGHLIVVLENGSVVSFGDVDDLLSQIDVYLNTKDADEEAKKTARERLSSLLRVLHGPEGRSRVIDGLADLGVNVGEKQAREGSIVSWHLLGPVPFPEGSTIEDAVIDESALDGSTPVTVDGKPLGWREYRTELPRGEMELVRMFGESAHTVVYAWTEVDLPEARDLLLKVGSDDGVKIWLNGEVVASNDARRGWTADQDIVPIRAKKGANTILMKITQAGGGWGFNARLTDRDDQPVDLSRMVSR